MTAGSGIEPAYAVALPAPQGGALPTSLEWQALERMAHTLADSDVIPYRLKRKPADVAVILLAAREYGIPPLMAMSKLPVVNGQPAPMGELMVALVLRAGHRITAKVHNADGTPYKGGDPITEGTYARCVTHRSDEPADYEDELTFTIAEALSAGLVDELVDGRTVARVTKTKNGQQVTEVTPWEQYPTNMLRWRSIANACRLRFPDVLLGMSYLPEELGARVDADGAPVVDGEVVDAPPAPRRAPEGSLAQRTAQEAADRLVEFTGPLEVLDKVLAHAEENGYATALVRYGDHAATPLVEAIAARRAELVEVARTTVDSTATDTPAPDAPAAAASAPQEAAPTPPDAPTEEAATATPTDEERARRTGAVDAGLAEPTGTGLAEAYVYDAVRTADADVIRGMYRECKAADLLDVDVAPILPVEALELELGTPVKLGALLMALGPRVASSGRPLVLEGPPEDEPDGSAEDPDPPAWDQPDAHPDELPLP